MLRAECCLSVGIISGLVALVSFLSTTLLLHPKTARDYAAGRAGGEKERDGIPGDGKAAIWSQRLLTLCGVVSLFSSAVYWASAMGLALILLAKLLD